MMIMWNMTTSPWLLFFFPSCWNVCSVPLGPLCCPIWSTWSDREGKEPAWAWNPVWDSWSSPCLLQNSFEAVLLVEDSCPTCPAQLGKASSAFFMVLATDTFLCLFIWRSHGKVSLLRRTRWLHCTAPGLVLKLCVQEEGWVSAQQIHVACRPSREGYWHTGEDVCLHSDVSMRWPSRTWYGQLAPSWLGGWELQPPKQTSSPGTYAEVEQGVSGRSQ